MREIEAKCGDCICWHPIELDPAQRLLMIGQPPRGFCFALPPTAHPVIKDGQMVGNVNLRPAMRADESCYMFEPRDGEATPAALPNAKKRGNG